MRARARPAYKHVRVLGVFGLEEHIMVALAQRTRLKSVSAPRLMDGTHSMLHAQQFINAKYVDHPTCDYAVCVCMCARVRGRNALGYV